MNNFATTIPISGISFSLGFIQLRNVGNTQTSAT